MATLLKQSTAVNIKLGPFVDEEDGFTALTSLTISQADVRLAKNDGNWGQKNDSNAATHEENGWYEVALDATDTGTLGTLIVAVNESGALPVWREFLVVPANVYDSLVAGSDNLQVDAASIRTAVGLASANLDTQLGTIDNNVDAIKAKTDELTFTEAGAVDANVQYVNDTEVAGDGQPGTEWGPAP